MKAPFFAAGPLSARSDRMPQFARRLKQLFLPVVWQSTLQCRSNAEANGSTLRRELKLPDLLEVSRGRISREAYAVRIDDGPRDRRNDDRHPEGNDRRLPFGHLAGFGFIQHSLPETGAKTVRNGPARVRRPVSICRSRSRYILHSDDVGAGLQVDAREPVTNPQAGGCRPAQ